jgi:S-DNA-T family DNA segregation ATPase FtsK/SpoIIIE
MPRPRDARPDDVERGTWVLELLLRVETQDGGATDVRAELADDHRVADLALAIAAHLGLSVPAGHVPNLASPRIGQVLDPEGPILASGVRSGDTLRLAVTFSDPGLLRTSEAGGLFCDVISGPSSGTSLPVGGGRFTVGREPECDLMLPDPTVSKRHAEVFVDEHGTVEVAPAEGATNPVVVDGVAIAGPTVVPLGAVVQLGACALTIRRYAPAVSGARDQLGQIPFNRTPYRHPDLREVEVRGPGRAPQPYEPRPLMFATMLLPLVGGVALAWWLGRWEFLLFIAISPLAMLANWISERRRGGTTYRRQVETFDRNLEDWVGRYDDALATERRRRTLAAPDVADLARRAELRTADLWPRSRRTEGFLQLRIGLGPAPALSATKRPSGVEEDPDGRVSTTIDERAELPSVPIVVDLLEHGTVALHGAPKEVETTAGSLLTQAVTLHSPDDLVVAAAVDPRRTLHRWLKWVPHVRTVTSPLAGGHLALGREEADDLLRRILDVIAERQDDSWPKLLLVLDELVEADHLLVAAVLESGPAVGVVALWIGEQHALVPRQAAAVLHCPPVSSGRRAELWFTDPTEPIRTIDPDRIGLETPPRVARALAPVRDASSASAAASIPRVAPLLEALGTPTLTADDVARLWKGVDRYGLAAPIGIGAAGPMVVDLVEHGPHGLIAGTSGAGKSELLQSLIASLISRYPPTRLNLLFIDYKGGASSNVFQPAPHTVGYVTNLGADLAMRALVSLRAELDARMRLLEGRAKDLEEMLEKHPDEAPPSLVIVVDEFATLVKEIPDFVAGMVDVAQRGRSLGIHLILATQRPTGAVNDNILANTNLRISLRVLDPADSSSILGSAEAAAIPGPLRGRGFAKLGAGGLNEFQSGYAGAAFTAAGGATPVLVESFPSDGRTTLVPEPATSGDEDAARTHLDVVLEAVVGAAEQLGLPRGKRPWLEDLPRSIPLAEVQAGRYGEVPEHVVGRDLVLGVVDLPQEQVQRPFLLDLEAEGGLLVFGTGGSGRSTVLRTVVGAAVSEASPRDVEVYVLDFGGRALEALRDLPHVAAVATSDDLEQVTRVLQHLRAEVTRRQQLLADARAEDLSALHHARPDERLPRLLLLVDGYEAFDRSFERGDLYQWSELLVETVLAGRSAGLHLVATGGRRVSVPAGLANAVGGRIMLRMADSDGLIDLGVPASVARSAELGDGRALLADGTTLQLAIVGDDVSNAGQASALDALARSTAAGEVASLPVLPDDLRLDALTPAASAGSEAVVVGLADLTGAGVTVDLRLHHLAVIGPGESGRSTAVTTAARGLRAGGADVWALGTDPDSPLFRVAWDHACVERAGHRAFLEELRASLVAGGPPPVLAIDQGERVADDATMLLDQLLGDGAVRLVAAADGVTMSSFVSGWMSQLKTTRKVLLLQPDDIGDTSTITPVRFRLRPGQPFPPGRGVLIDGRRWQLVHVAR